MTITIFCSHCKKEFDHAKARSPKLRILPTSMREEHRDVVTCPHCETVLQIDHKIIKGRRG